MMISLCRIYAIHFSKDRTFSHAKWEYKRNNHGIFPTHNPHPIYHDLEHFQSKQEGKHEAKQQAESLNSA